MVDRVGNGPGYEYNRVNERKINSSASGTGEKFQLDYGKEGAIYEPSSTALEKQHAQKSATSSRSQETGKAEENGVKLTLSNAGLERSETVKQESTSIMDMVTGWVNKIVDTIKGIFSSFWNETGEENSAVETKNVEENAMDWEVSTATETMKGTENPVETIQKPRTQFEKAKAEANAFLASTEGKKVARNSDLLTYYDRHGMVVSVSASDKQKILYGDKNHIDV